MFSKILVLVVAAAFLPVASLMPAQAQGTGVVYNLYIDCPTNGGFALSTGGSCPVRAVDQSDMMGDPSLAVDSLDPSNLIIASLHGCVDNGGPSVKSRSSVTSCGSLGTLYPFTTFTSTDYGANWFDSPYPPPSNVTNAYGEHAQVTIDPYGHVYIGSLYARPKGSGSFEYEIGAQKFEDLKTIEAQQGAGNGDCAGCYHLSWVQPIYPKNAIRNMWFLFNPRTDNMTIVWIEVNQKAVNETQPAPPTCLLPLPDPVPCIPSPIAAPSSTEVAAEARHNHPGQDVVTSPASSADMAQPRSSIGVVWTGVDLNDTYHRQSFADSIGPCSDSTNPVLSDGYLYIGCVTNPKEGTFRWHNATAPGSIELFRMDPNGGVPEYMGVSPIIGGSPKLGVRSDGRLALVSTQARDGHLELVTAFGHYHPEKHGIEWGPIGSYGDKISPPIPGIQVVRPNIQSLIYREQSGVIHFILRESVYPKGVGVDALQTSLKPHIRKSIVAIDEEHGVVGKFPLDIGNLLNRTSDTSIMSSPELSYEDLSDDFLQLPPTADNLTYTDKAGVVHQLGANYSREFFAIGDYGQVIFAELIEITNLRAPSLPIPPEFPPALAAPALSPAAILVPAAGVSLTALVAVSFVANRRKNPAAAFAKLKKK